MNEVYEQHLARVRQATISRLGRKDLPRWIERNTFINGKPFSFLDHEFQERILTEEAPEIVIRKSAQTGISEMSLRAAAGLVMIMPGAFRIGYTFPTASFASDYAKTRFSPIVRGSPALRSAISSDDVDTADTKTFGPGKEIYFKGAAVGNAAISTTLDMLIHDELSFSDMTVIGDYHSRLIHSAYKWRLSLSTPTFPGDPIDTAFAASRRWWNMCRCQHCSHRFVPDFYEHVSIPGWSNHLDEITADNLHLVRYGEAQFLCPACKKPTSLQKEFREWVCENPSENRVAVGFQVQPFDAPNVVTLSDLIIASTKYATKAKFRQFSLGRPSVDADSGLTDEDIDSASLEMLTSPFSTHVMGIDLGLYCHFTIGGLDQFGRLVVVHYERVPLSKFRERYWALKAEYRVVATVSDIQPYTDLIMSLSNEDATLFGASYVTRNGLETFDVKQREEDPDNAKAGLRGVDVNRNAVFDKLLAEVRAGSIMFRKNRPDFDVLKAHLQDMKRATATLRNGEFTSVWQKSSKGQDHYHHSLAYLWVAGQIRGVAAGFISGLDMGVQKFKVTGPPPKPGAGGIYNR